MPRQTGTVTENNFIKGLITETTGLRFPTDACTETWNCIFDETGRVTRRLGIDIEEEQGTQDLVVTKEEATSSYLWTYIGSFVDGSFLVQQIGNIVYFFDVTASNQVGSNKKSFTVDLTEHQSKQTIAPTEFICQYAQGAGRLIIVNQACVPLLVKYDIITDNITVSEIAIKYRDFEGLDDGLDVTRRLTSTLANLITNEPKHVYNLLNQGWYATGGSTDALEQWDAARTDMPSNADAPVYYRSTNQQTLIDNLIVNGTDPGNSPAPKGHFILSLGLASREEQALADGYTLDLDEEASIGVITLPQATGTLISGGATNPANVFDENSTTYALLGQAYTGSISNPTPADYVGRDLGGEPKRIGAVQLAWSRTDVLSSSGYSIRNLRLYASNTAPTSATNGTLIGTVSNFSLSSTTSTFKRIPSNDTITSYRYVWIAYASFVTGALGGGYGDAPLSDFNIETFDTSAVTDKSAGPRSVAFFASRAFYAGVNDPNLGSNIYFSQLIESDDQFGKCYQVNDPTSIEIADLLATDGGVIKIPDIGAVQKLFTFQNQLLVLAANGVWSISGPSNGAFSATGYIVNRLSSIGMSSPQSVVDVKGLPVWWGEDGIYTVKFDANYGSTVVISLTEDSIKQFYLDIPEESRKFAKGTYDRFEDIAYWIFSDEEVSAVGNFSYNKTLCLNTKTSAFYPWEIERSVSTPQYLKDILFVQDGLRNTSPSVKLLTTNPSKYFFSAFINTSYLDWTNYSSVISLEADDQVDYMSYFISGYRVDGDGMLFFQAPYVFWYLEPESFSYINTRALFDWTTSTSANKWSAPQAIECRPIGYSQYKELKTYRRKYRGKGRAMQLKVESDTGKPFTLLGWGILASSSSTV